MKYIRTKDGIIEYNPNEMVSNNGVHIFINDDWNKSDYIYYEKDIVAQADTIEELCDEFVWVSVDNEYHNRKANEYGLRTSRMQVNSPQMKTIYGAIWTDKGLIYVAKMNKKGELCLL